MSTVVATVISTVTGTVTGTLVSDGGGPIYWVPNLDGTAYGRFTDVWAPTGAGSTLSITLVYKSDGAAAQIIDGDASAFSLSVSAANAILFNLLTSVEIDGVPATSGVTVLTDGYHTITGTLDATADMQVLAATAALASQFESQIHEIILTDPVTPANSVLIDTCYRSSSMPESVPVYMFNGANQYATFADWVPNGLPFSVEVNAIPLTVDNSDAYIVASTSSDNRIANNSSNLQNFRWRNALDTGTLVANLATPAEVGVAYTRKLEGLSDGLHGSSNGETSTTLGNLLTNTISPITRIGSAGNNGAVWHGPVWGLKLTDNSVIQNTDVLDQNGARVITIPSFNMVSGGTVSVELIYSDGVILDGSVAVLTGVAGVITAGANVANMTVDGVAYAGAVIPDGQHIAVAFDVSAGTIDTAGAMTTGAITNLILDNSTDYAHYKVDEGAGTAVLGYDIGGVNVPSLDGVVTPDAAWSNIPDNSRTYDMHEGTGATLACVDGTGTPQPALNATIQNFVEADWGSITTFPGAQPPVITGLQNNGDPFGAWINLDPIQPYVPKILGGGLNGEYEANKSQVYAGDYGAGDWTLGVDSVNIKAISSGETDGKVGSVYPAVLAAENDIGVAANGSVVKFNGVVASTYGRGYDLLQGDDAKVQTGFEYPNVFRLITSADTSGEWTYFDEGGTAPWPGPIEGDAFLGVFNASLEGFTFARSSSAWGVAEDGIIYESITDEPVYPGCGNDGAGNWLPDAGFQGLLLEGAGENYIVDPAEFEGWNNAGVTITDNAASGPLNGMMASRVEETASTSQHRVFQTGSWLTTDNVSLSSTLIAKPDERTISRSLRGSRDGDKTTYFDHSTNAFSNTSVELDYLDSDALTDDWDMVYIGLSDVGAGSDTGSFVFALSDGTFSASYTGALGSGQYLAAAQIELHPFPTSLMLNGTRSATNCSQTLASMGLADQTNDFTAQIKFEQIADREFYQGVGNVVLFDIAESANNRLTCYYDTANDNVVAQKTVGGVAGTSAVANIGAKLRGEAINIGVVADSVDGLYIYVDGVLIQNQPGETANFGAALSDCYLGNDYAGAGNHFNIVKELNFWAEVVTPAQVRGIHVFGAASFTPQ